MKIVFTVHLSALKVQFQMEYLSIRCRSLHFNFVEKISFAQNEKKSFLQKL